MTDTATPEPILTWDEANYLCNCVYGQRQQVLKQKPGTYAERQKMLKQLEDLFIKLETIRNDQPDPRTAGQSEPDGTPAG